MGTPKLTAPKGAEFEKQLVPAGIQNAICYSIVDLGSQEVTREGNTFLQRKVQVTFETEHMGEFDGEQKPLVIGKRYTLSFSPKSALFKDLTSWLGKKPQEDFDIMELVGKKAQLQVIESEGSNGKTYHNINTILPSDHEQKNFNDYVRFSLQDFEQGEFDKLPKWMKETVEKSPEYQEIKNPREKVEEEEKVDDDLPF